MRMRTAFTITLLVSSCTAASATNRPKVFTDHGACPGEGCGYGPRKTTRDTFILAEPRRGSKRIATLKQGTEVRAVTGFVRTKAGRFRVLRDHGRYKAGETIWVYTYHGEGYFLVWYKGRMFQQGLEFSPAGGSMGRRCEKQPEYCWGRLDRELESVWWIKIRLRDGRTGWTNRPQDYGDVDG